MEFPSSYLDKTFKYIPKKFPQFLEFYYFVIKQIIFFVDLKFYQLKYLYIYN